MSPEPNISSSRMAPQLIDEILRRPLTRRELMKRSGKAGVALTGASVLLSACGSSGSSGGGSGGAQELVMTSGANPVTLDPMLSLDGQSPLLWRCCYESLLRYKGGGIAVEPHLAKDYEYDTKSGQLVFHLRDGVKFSDGTVLDAGAVKLNIERQLAVKQGIAYALFAIKSVETPDDHTVVVHTSGYSDGLIDGFASLYGLYMISPKAINDHKQGNNWAQPWLRSNMIGTGPTCWAATRSTSRRSSRATTTTGAGSAARTSVAWSSSTSMIPRASSSSFSAGRAGGVLPARR